MCTLFFSVNIILKYISQLCKYNVLNTVVYSMKRLVLLLCFMQIGEGHIPYKKEIRGKVYKAKEPVESAKKETKRSKFADELDQMLSLVEQDDLADLVSKY